MGLMIVNGAQFEIEVDSPATGTPAKTVVTLEVKSGVDVAAQMASAAVRDDMESQQPVTIGYNVGSFSGGQLEWDGKFLGFQESTTVQKGSNPVIVDDTDQGTIVWTVKSPATNPPAPPDMSSSYSGKWTLKDPGQPTVQGGA